MTKPPSVILLANLVTYADAIARPIDAVHTSARTST